MDFFSSGVGAFLLLAGVLLVPALLFFSAFTYARLRRSRFRRRGAHSRH
jgi:hypothetical protein